MDNVNQTVDEFRNTKHQAAIRAIEAELENNSQATIPIGRFVKALEEDYNEGETIQFLEKLSHKYPRNRELLLSLVRILNSSGKQQKIIELYRKNKDWIANKDLHHFMEFGMPDDLKADEESFFQSINNGSPQAHLKLAASWFHGRDEDKAANFSSVFLASALGGTAPDIALVAPKDAELKRPLVSTIVNDDEALVAAHKGCCGTVLVFTGLQRAVGSMSIGILDRYFAARNLAVVYLRDNERLLFLNGIGSLGRGYSATAKKLRAMVAEIGSPHLFTFSTSAGGLAAMHYGLELGAESAICFSPPSNITPDFLRDETRGRLVQKRLASLTPQQLWDVKPRLDEANGAMKVHIYVGEYAAMDRRYADYLKDVEGISVHYLEGCGDHNTLPEAASRIGFLNMIDMHFLTQKSVMPEL